MMKKSGRDLDTITLNYWEVSTAVKHPDAPSMSTEKALKKLQVADRLRPSDWRLAALFHDIRYDIIEANTTWREKRQVAGSVSILRTKD